jgi:hypothetical protein
VQVLGANPSYCRAKPHHGDVSVFDDFREARGCDSTPVRREGGIVVDYGYQTTAMAKPNGHRRQQHVNNTQSRPWDARSRRQIRVADLPPDGR